MTGIFLPKFANFDLNKVFSVDYTCFLTTIRFYEIQCNCHDFKFIIYAKFMTSLVKIQDGRPFKLDYVMMSSYLMVMTQKFFEDLFYMFVNL